MNAVSGSPDSRILKRLHRPSKVKYRRQMRAISDFLLAPETINKCPDNALLSF
jgi:hypothetical protein